MACARGGPSVPRMFKRIVVGYAGDRGGRDGVVLAARLAQLTGAAVTVAIPYHPLYASVPADVASQRAIEEIAAVLGEEQLPRETRVRWTNASWPIHALNELAGFERADLIVFGATPGRTERPHIGTMERMVHGAPCAVAVAPDGYAGGELRPIASVGVGVAETDEGREAANVACELARRAGGDIRLIAGSGLSPSLAAYAFPSPLPSTLDEEMLEEMRSVVARVAQRLDTPGEPLLDVRRGDPSEVLVAASRELDLLVLGSRDYGPLRHVMLGSVSASVMRASRCPVLVLPRHTLYTPTTAAAAVAQAER